MGLPERNYPLNCWWVAARSEEVTRQPMQRWLLDVPVVMYRAEDGSPVALDNRCPHRWAPLSDGFLEGDNIVCPYHGARFAPDGHCPKFPGQETVTKNMRVSAFSMVERGPFIWIWMGDDAVRQQTDLPPDFAWSKEPSFYSTTGDYEFAANYLLLHENVLDLTHFNYVHAKSFGFTSFPAPQKYDVDGDRVGYLTIVHTDDELTDHERMVQGLAHPDAERAVSNCWFETPAVHVAKAFVGAKPGSSVPILHTTHINHMVTPASPTHTYYWWLVGTDAPMPAEAKQAYGATVSRAYHEDKVVLESIQTILDRDPRGLNYPEISFKGDAGGMLARSAVKRLLEAERGGDKASKAAKTLEPEPVG